jgi:Bacteriophage head to tail connecting protein
MQIQAPIQIPKPLNVVPPSQVAQSPEMAAIGNRIKMRYAAMFGYKAPWIHDYRLASIYCMRRKWNFTGYMYADEGAFVTNEVFDATAPNALDLMCSSLIGQLWPNGSKSVQITAAQSMSQEDRNSKELKEWYEHCTKVLAEVIDKPEAGFQTALEEYMNDQGAFGISGISVHENENDDNTPVRFEAVDAKRLVVAEGKDGYIDTVYIHRFVTVRQLVQRFGLDRVSQTVRDRYTKPDGTTLEEKVSYIEAIEPRNDAMRSGYGNAHKPIASVYVEYDTNHVLKISGYDEMPSFITRFKKRMGEVYGRSPAMESMADILEINSRREMLIVADEKMLNPPLAVYDDGQLGGGSVDTSAGAISVFHVTGRQSANHKVIEQIVTIGDLQSSYKRVTELIDIIRLAFNIDRLTDFNNDTRMTAEEVRIRNQMRNQSLNAIYSRQINELFSRLVARVFNICFNRGLFGLHPNDPRVRRALMLGQPVKVIPQRVLQLIAEGKEAYHAEFISPAARAMKAEELNGVQQLVTYILGLMNASPTVIDMVDLDKVIRKVQYLSGAPSDVLRSDEEVAKLRQAKNQAAQQQQKLAEGKITAETVRAAGQGAQAAAKAGIDPTQLASALATTQGQQNVA